ncbi:hypothetical protein QZH41_004132 [Actinostola sp. cb2023]|nr:hypothetical protein QZH41_004132 [Actinostola sp. cb2023]
MGACFSNLKFKRTNKVSPVPLKACPFSQQLLKRAQTLLDEENALLKKSVFTQTELSFLRMSNEKQRCQTPTWLSYDLDLDGNIVTKGLKRSCPGKLEKDPKLPVLTMEMLLEKQAQAERNRNKQLENRKEASMRSVEVKQRQDYEEIERLAKVAKLAEKQLLKLAKAIENREAFLETRRKTASMSVELKHKNKSDEEEAERLNKAAKLAGKHARAAAKREAQIELVKTRANKGLNNARSKLVEAQRFAKAQQTDEHSQRKMNTVKANRDRAVRRVVHKQRQRESHAQRLRARAAKQQKEEEEEEDEFDKEWNAIEADPNYYASDSGEEDKAMERLLDPLAVRFITKRFIGEYDSSQDFHYQCQASIDDEQINIEILDPGPLVPGQARDRVIESHSMWGDSFVLIYSITNRNSFNSIINYYQALSNVKLKPVVVLMANNSDLEHKRKVLKSEGSQLAELMKCPFYECSASDGSEKITLAFHDLYREGIRKKKERKYSLSPRPLRSAMGKLFRRSSSKGNLLSPESYI